MNLKTRTEALGDPRPPTRLLSQPLVDFSFIHLYFTKPVAKKNNKQQKKQNKIK